MPEPQPPERLEQLESDNARLRRLLDRQDVGAELRHQTRNVLSILRTLIRRSAESSQTVEDYAAHLEGRLDVILRTQNLILNHPDGVSLHLLVAEELRVFGADEDGQARLSGPQILLRPRTAEVLALAFHELSANAMKFGTLTSGNGLVEVAWALDSASGAVPVLTLTWQESGAAPCETEPQRKGFGRNVLETMIPYELQAESALSFSPTGVRYELRLPLTPKIATVLGPQP